jgi:hypothetical protein
MRKLITIIFCILQFILLSGCSFTTRYMRSLLGKQDENLPVFMDDFSDHDNGWLVTVADNGIVHYDGDAMRILIREPNAEYWTTPGLNLTNSSVDVDTIRVTGPENNLFGLVCRWRDQNNYYSFLVSSDGYYGIVRMKDGKRQIISGDEMQTTDLVLKGDRINHIRADCNGKTLTLYLNFTKLVQVDDTIFERGDVGLIAGTLADSGTDIRFDNFIVQVPK